MKDTHSHNDNDANDPLPFIALAALTANVVTHLSAGKRQPDGNADSRANGNAEQKPEKHTERDCEGIKQRLEAVAAFERIARGEVRRPRRGPA
ncbi:hypothetical protein [Bradyrhizobium ivorense]|uniref:hypothetical protein n=1 Tax=Bradyrhizobium ivorense TaxID=2511166 RepID=UPI0011169F72|nr:hypothetical protein [Bradyrhizobium ivorense]